MNGYKASLSGIDVYSGRKAEKYNVISHKWEESYFMDLNNGDIFRFFDNGGRYTNMNNNSNVWMALGEAWLNEEEIPIIKTQMSFIEIE